MCTLKVRGSERRDAALTALYKKLIDKPSAEVLRFFAKF
jgi:hypothetical protein